MKVKVSVKPDAMWRHRGPRSDPRQNNHVHHSLQTAHACSHNRLLRSNVKTHHPARSPFQLQLAPTSTLARSYSCRKEVLISEADKRRWAAFNSSSLIRELSLGRGGQINKPQKLLDIYRWFTEMASGFCSSALKLRGTLTEQSCATSGKTLKHTQIEQ